ncbi:MAG: rho [Pseudonocardiales bacterium]|nr:rho [Pseudonocardiales bacterium]
MLLPELQSLAGSLGISAAKMRKADLVTAINAAQTTAPAPAKAAPARRATRAAGATNGAAVSTNGSAEAENGSTTRSSAQNGQTASPPSANGGSARTSVVAEQPMLPAADAPTTREPRRETTRREREPRESREAREPREQPAQREPREAREPRDQTAPRESREPREAREPRDQAPARDTQNGSNQSVSARREQEPARREQEPARERTQPARQQDAFRSDRNENNRLDSVEEDGDRNGRRGRRYRDRRGRTTTTTGRTQGGNPSAAQPNDIEPSVSEDDILVPVAGILDAVEDKNTWFVRTNGYFASSDDIYVANSFIRRFNLRRGDAVTGAIRQVSGEKREKFSPLVRLDTVNGLDPEQVRNRVEFTKLTPLYPQDRLRLETETHILTTRVIDLVMPIGKGQRALIVSPPKAGKTMVLQAIANAIATNNPEVHLMVVLIDERPEEVTDMQRSVKGEVIASTFDRRPHDHTTVAELSIERAKRLVEMGHDVVVLLDSITRLGRAYNLAAPASGRILSGGVDSTALYPPKRFLGAARNIENGGSLTIIATALVETGSAGDTVIFEEFKGTGNAELKLDRKIADKRVFPAIDVDQSSTRKEEILLSPDELAVVIKLRRVLHALESQQAIDLLLDRLKKTRTNIEFLMQIAKTTPGND